MFINISIFHTLIKIHYFEVLVTIRNLYLEIMIIRIRIHEHFIFNI